MEWRTFKFSEDFLGNNVLVLFGIPKNAQNQDKTRELVIKIVRFIIFGFRKTDI